MTPETEALARLVGDLEPEDFHDRIADLPWEDQREALRLRFRFNVEEFCRWCWPDRFNLPFNELHTSILDRSSNPGWRYRVTTTRDAVAAPRGYAKSTLSCFAQVIHAVVYDLEACVVMLSAGQRLALAQVKDLKTAVEDEDGGLWALYGPISTSGPLSELLISVDGQPAAAILPASFGSDVRGFRHPTRGIRPGLAVVDDGEKKDRVRSAEQRRIWWDFLTKDVMKLGPREGGFRLWVRGTVLHTDSMLARALTHPGFRSEKWAAIIHWPANAEMWEQCGRLWANLADDDRAVTAREFYELNRDEMEEGVEVLDPQTEGIFALFTQIWGEGLGAFLQEKQNDPRDPLTQVFETKRFARCRVEGETLITADGRRVPLKELRRRYIRWDPAMGNAAGDFAALVVGLRDHFGYTYIVDAWLRKAKPSAQLAAMWALCERWKVSRVSLESNGFQAILGETFAREKEERRGKGMFWKVTCHEEPSTDNKEARISALEPDCHNGWIQFGDRVSQEGIGQFGDFPSGAHDDFPDAVEGCHRGLGGNPAQMSNRRLR
jgi:predicted phage terminase large subunit-like protein